MTTSDYMSDVVVEIAFNAGFSTPAADRVWTDVSQWVELSAGISIGYGRQDERSQADANTLSLTLDNRDGRFTPQRPTSPYYPNVRLYRPIRVTATPPGGTPSVRFTGYIDSWPVAWEGTDTYASANLSASSRLARLGLTDSRRSAVEEEILSHDPVAYYTLGDPEGSTSASDSSGNGQPAALSVGLGSPVIFGAGTGVSTDGLTAAQINGRILRVKGLSVAPGSGGITVVAFIYSPGSSPGVSVSLQKDGPGNVQRSVDLGGFSGNINATGFYADGVNGYSAVSNNPVPSYASETHLFAYVLDRTTDTIRTYFDGALVDPGTSTTALALAGVVFDTLYIGGGTEGSAAAAKTMSHVAVYDRVLTGADLTSIATSGLTGFASETSAARLIRYASYAGIPASEVQTGGLDQTHIALDSSGAGLVDLMRQIEATESAVLFDRRDGKLALVAESVRYTATPAFTLDMAAQDVGADFAPQLDPSAILNDFTVTRVGGSPSARVVDSDSRDENGVAASSLEVTSTDDGLMLQLAAWQVARFAEPKSRVPAITVDVNGQVGKTPSPDDLLAADVHTLIAVTNQPAQAASSAGSYFVEGYNETIGAHSHVISYNVSPAEPFTKVFILNDPVRGALDGTYMLGL